MKQRRSRGALISAVIASAALIAGVLATPAAAHHIPGRTYSGSIWGWQIAFNVSTDGSSVTGVRVEGPAHPYCPGVPPLVDPGPYTISGNSFHIYRSQPNAFMASVAATPST